MKRRKGHGPPVLVNAPPAGKFASASATSGAGTFVDPWTLAQAFSSASAGDVVWLRGGSYATTTGFTVSVSGTAGNPITFRSYPGEWAAIYASTSLAAAVVTVGDGSAGVGDYIRLVDLEIYKDWATRVGISSNEGSALSVYGDTFQGRNLICHDGGAANYGWWEQSAGDGELYGCLGYNSGCGTSGDVLGHGDGYYMQNIAPNTKLIKHNITGYAFNSGLKLGTAGGHIENFTVEDSVVMCAAGHLDLVAASAGLGIEFYTINNPGTDNVFDGLMLWSVRDGVKTASSGFAHSYGDGGMVDYTVQNSFLVSIGRGSVKAGSVIAQEKPVSGTLTMTGNTVAQMNADGSGTFAYYESAGAEPATRTFNNNAYYRYPTIVDALWLLRVSGTPTWYAPSDFAAYQAVAGEAGSSVTVGATSKPADQAWLFANTYESKRANIVVYNSVAQANTVNVDCDSIFNNDDLWYLYNAMNPLAGPVASGVYTTGNGIDVPMTDGVVGDPATAIGTASPPASQLPDFGAFVVRNTSTWVAPPESLML